MIPTYWLAGIRHLLRHRWLTALSVLGIALGVAVVIAVDMASSSARHALNLSMRGVVGQATHHIVGGPGGIDQTIYSDLRLAGWSYPSAPVIEATVTPADRPGLSFRLLGVDGVAEAPFRGFGSTGGAGQFSLRGTTRWMTLAGQILLSAPGAAELGLSKGDTVDLLLPMGRDTVTVAGVFEAPADEQMVSGLMLMDIAGAQELLRMDRRITRIDLQVPKGEAGEQALAELAARLSPGLRIETAGTRTRAMEGMTRAFDFNLAAMSLLALVVGLYLIYNTMSFAIVQRRPLLGTLRTLGVTREQIFIGVTVEAVLLGIVGTALGLLLGTALARFLLALVARTINDMYYALQITQLYLDPVSVAKGAALGLVGSVLAAIVPAVEAARTPPRMVLNRSVLEGRVHRLAPALARAGVVLLVLMAPLLLWPSQSLLPAYGALVALVLAASLFMPSITLWLMTGVDRLLPVNGSLEARLAARGVSGSLSRTGLAIAALTIALSTNVGVGTMIASFRDSVSTWLERTLSAEIYVSPGVASPRGAVVIESVADRLRDIPGVRQVVAIRASEIETRSGPIRVTGFDVVPEVRDALLLQAGRPKTAFPAITDPERAVPAALASEPLAFHNRLSVGDRITLASERGWIEVEIVGVYQDYGSDRGNLLVGSETFIRLWPSRKGFNGIGLYLVEGADQQAVVSAAQQLASPANPLSVMQTRGILEYSLEVFERTFAVTGVLQLLTLVVSIVGVTSALMALQLERAKETAVIRALGMTPGQVGRMVTGQTALMGAVAGLTAVPVGLVLAAVLTGAINQRAFGWSIDFVWSFSVLSQTLFTAIIAAVVAGLYPAWRMATTPAALALRED